jgi:prophage regulatory protein
LIAASSNATAARMGKRTPTRELCEVVTATCAGFHRPEDQQMPIYLRRRAVLARYGLRTSTLYGWIAKGLFPRPVRMGPRAVGWAVDELEAWERSRTATQPTESQPAAIFYRS